MLGKILLPLIVFLRGIYSLKESDSTCQSVHTYGYGYRQFYNIPESSFINGSIVFNFSLSTPSNGHVLFSEKAYSYPGYEIVIGAGGNEFSEIRKYRTSKLEPKTHLMSKDIVSSTQMKNFSVVIKDSVVSLYAMNGSKWLHILSWEDTSPLDVKYFSFCSWTGVAGKWLFDCKGTNAVIGEITPLRQLRKKLMSDYDPYSIPANDINKLTIDASIDLQYITLDAKKSLLTTHGKFYFTWIDPRMMWNPDDYDNITSITLLHREIWLPDFILHNSQDQGTSPMEKAIIRIQSSGKVSWAPEAKLITWCSLDLKNWPFDEHRCYINLGLYSHPDYVHISLYSKNVKSELKLKNLEWKIISLIGETTTIVNPWEYNNTSDKIPSAFTINIGLKRQVQMHIYVFVFPTVVCIFITLACFWLPIFVSKRLYLHFICMLVLTINLILLDIALPALTSSTPYLLEVNSNLLLITVIHIIFCGYLTSKVKDYEKYVSKFLNRIVTHPMVHAVFCPLMHTQYHNMKDSQTDTNGTSEQNMNQWQLFGLIVDRFLFFFTIIYISVILIL